MKHCICIFSKWVFLETKDAIFTTSIPCWIDTRFYSHWQKLNILTVKLKIHFTSTVVNCCDNINVRKISAPFITFNYFTRHSLLITLVPWFSIIPSKLLLALGIKSHLHLPLQRETCKPFYCSTLPHLGCKIIKILNSYYPTISHACAVLVDDSIFNAYP